MNKDKQRLLRAVVNFLAEDNGGIWPEPATKFTQRNSYELESDEPVNISAKWCGDGEYEDFEVEGLAYMEEYDDGESITKEEYLQFMQDNPTYLQDLPGRQAAVTAEIARLNKKVGAMIDQMTELAESVALDFSIDLGKNGSLDLNSDWDSSRC